MLRARPGILLALRVPGDKYSPERLACQAKHKILGHLKLDCVSPNNKLSTMTGCVTVNKIQLSRLTRNYIVRFERVRYKQ